MIRVFFYGTLKRNESNNNQLLGKNITFVSEATTIAEWPLIIATHLNLPFLLNKKGYGKVIYGLFKIKTFINSYLFFDLLITAYPW